MITIIYEKFQKNSLRAVGKTSGKMKTFKTLNMRHISYLIELTNSQNISAKSSPILDETALEFLHNFHKYVKNMAGSGVIRGVKEKYVEDYIGQYIHISFVQALFILPVNNIEKAAFCLFIRAKICSKKNCDVEDISSYWRSFSNKKEAIETIRFNKIDYEH